MTKISNLLVNKNKLEFGNHFIKNSGKLENLAQKIKNFQKIEEIHMGRYAFTSLELIDCFSNSIKNIKSLKKLNLGENCIDDHGAKIIASSLEFTDIEEINLGWNNLTEKGRKFFYELINTKRLKTFHFGINNLGKDTENSLIQELMVNQSLESINLGNSTVFINVASDILNYSNSVKKFSAIISPNFTSREIAQFSEIVANHPNIRDLRLPSLKATSKDLEFLEAACSTNKKINKITLENSLISEKSKHKILEIIQTNHRNSSFFNETGYRLYQDFTFLMAQNAVKAHQSDQ